jgi:hypothetical protein
MRGAHGATWMGTGGGWPVDGNVSMGQIHGPWRSGAARSRTRVRAEEGGQWWGGGSSAPRCSGEEGGGLVAPEAAPGAEGCSLTCAWAWGSSEQSYPRWPSVAKNRGGCGDLPERTGGWWCKQEARGGVHFIDLRCKKGTQGWRGIRVRRQGGIWQRARTC